MRFARLLALFALALCFCGCIFGGQTGQEDSIGREPGDCMWERTPVDPADAEALGFSASDLEASLDMPITSTLLWSRMQSRTDFAFELLETRERYVSVSQNGACATRMEAEVRASIETSDGLLNEEVDATVLADSLERVDIRASIPFDAIEGTLSFDTLMLDPNLLADPNLELHLSRSDGALNANIFLNGDDPTPNDDEHPTSPTIAELPAP